ncbi:MAG TPA: ABC transporter ATP-binding protein, partial [Capillimicrobium sp.]
PINRERLQDEFLRLQGQLRKTVVFVTHDIDEAIKMGDRIAVMKTGGRLAQYATPAELLVRPADAFVEGFVGADRALKRLSLLRVRDVHLDPPATAAGADGAAMHCDTVLRDALSALLQAGAQRAPVVDGSGALVGVLSVALVGELLAEGNTEQESASERAEGAA